jgi:transposase
MSMKPQPIPEIPAETVRVVRAVFPKGNIYIHLRDTFVSTCTISRPGIEDAR